MPDLNLIDEGGFEDLPVPAAAVPPAKKKTSSSGGGGGGKTIIILLMVLILCAAGVYLLNQRGIIKLWGKKKPLVAQIQDEPFPQEPAQQSSQEQPTQTPKQDDTTVTLLEAPPGEENLETAPEPEAKVAKPSADKPKAKKEKAEVVETETSSKLSEMQGEYTIQVVAYKEKKQAVEIANNLEIAGYPSFVEKVPMKGGDWYTVRVGRYASPEEAKKAVKTFAAQLQAHYVIDKIRTK
jgi:cell division protein FtsN